MVTNLKEKCFSLLFMLFHYEYVMKGAGLCAPQGVKEKKM